MRKLLILGAVALLAGCEVVENNSAAATNVADENAMTALERSADNLEAETNDQANAQAAAIGNEADDLELALEDNGAAPAGNATNSN